MSVIWKEVVRTERDPIIKICNKCKKEIKWTKEGWEEDFNIFIVSQCKRFTSSMECDREVHLCIDCTIELLHDYFEPKQEFTGM